MDGGCGGGGGLVACWRGRGGFFRQVQRGIGGTGGSGTASDVHLKLDEARGGRGCRHHGLRGTNGSGGGAAGLLGHDGHRWGDRCRMW